MQLNADECRQAVEKSKYGDLDSFGKLVQYYYPVLHRYVACRVGDAAEVDDVLQEILLLAWLNINKLRNTNAFKVWLMCIANNCCNKWYISKALFDVPAEDDALTSLECLRVLDRWEDSPRILVENYMSREGRSILFRRYNHPVWKLERYGQRWDEKLPNANRISINGEEYIHWYDCLSDIAF